MDTDSNVTSNTLMDFVLFVSTNLSRGVCVMKWNIKSHRQDQPKMINVILR